MLASRFPALRVVGTLFAVQIGCTLFLNNTGPQLITIKDYMEDQAFRKQFVISGMVKPNSMRNDRGLIWQFKITDLQYQLTCKYNSTIKTELKEGQIVALQAMCPNPQNKHTIYVKHVMTKHSMQVNEWKDKIDVSRKGFGIDAGYS